jgi:hypothetical protein
MQLSADDAKTHALTQEIAALLTYANDTTEVEISQCTLQIQTLLRTTCEYSSQPKWKKTTLRLDEISSFEMRPFQERAVMSVDLDVPLPSRFQTQLNHLIKGKDVAFEVFSKESERLLAESDIVSNQTHVSCDGTVYAKKRRSLTLFFDKAPKMIEHFAVLVDQCQQ